MKNEPPAKRALTRTEANRENAQHSTGPNNTASTRFNAVKHGLLAEAVTELDSPETFHAFLARLEGQLQPVGDVETYLVRRIALGMLRVHRAAVLEAEYLTAKLNAPITQKTLNAMDMERMLAEMTGKTSVLDPGLPARLTAEDVDSLTSKFQRYETAVENKLYRSIHELERMQRLRRGENLPAPNSVDVAVHTDSPRVASFGNPPTAET
jgi:hypothetical protein